MAAAVAAIVVAAGRGFAPAAICPSNTGRSAGEPVIRPSLALSLAWRSAASNQSSILTTAACSRAEPGPQAAAAGGRGGATRQASVRAGLEALARPARTSCWSMTPPAVRSPALIDARSLRRQPAPRSALPVDDTVKRIDAGARRRDARPRRSRTVQTPQAFALHRWSMRTSPAHAGREDFTDDAALAEWAGLDGRGIRG